MSTPPDASEGKRHQQQPSASPLSSLGRPLVDSPEDGTSPLGQAPPSPPPPRAAAPPGRPLQPSVTADLERVSLQLSQRPASPEPSSYFPRPVAFSPPSLSGPTSPTSASPTSPRARTGGHTSAPLSPPAHIFSPRVPKGPKLALLNTNTVYLPPAASGGAEALTPSQVRWQRVRDVVVGPSTDGPPTTAGLSAFATTTTTTTTAASSRRGTADGGHQAQAQAPPVSRAGFLANLGLGKQRSSTDAPSSSSSSRPTFTRAGSSDVKPTGGRSKQFKAGSAPFGFLLGSSASGAPPRGPNARAGEASARAPAGQDPRLARFEADLRGAVLRERKAAAERERDVRGVGEDGTAASGSASSSARTRTGHSKSSSSHSAFGSFGSSGPGSSSTAPPLAAILEVLHAYVPSASQPWAQPFPCEAAVLAELGRPYARPRTTDSAAGYDYRPMALDVFALVVKHWPSASDELELGRWTWALTAIQAGGAPATRERATLLLVSLLDPRSPTAPIPTHPQSCAPDGPLAFRTLLSALVRASCALSSDPPSPSSASPPPTHAHHRSPSHPLSSNSPLDDLHSITARLRHGKVLLVDPQATATFFGLDDDRLTDEASDARALSEALAWDAVCWMVDAFDGDERAYVVREVLPTFAKPLVEHPVRRTPDILVERAAAVSLCRTLRRQLHQTAEDPSAAAAYTEADRCALFGFLRARFAAFLRTPTVVAAPEGSASWAEEYDDGEFAAELVGVLLALVLHRPAASPHGDTSALGGVDEESAGEQALAFADELWSSSARWKSAFHRSFLSLPSFARGPTAALLATLQADKPKLFYGALFKCAASDKTDVVALHLRIVRAQAAAVVSLDAYWLADAEMLAMAVVGGPPVTSPSAAGGPTWSKVKLGQLVVIATLVDAVREFAARATADEIGRHERFFGLLESRISVLADFRERTGLLCFSHRAALAALLHAVRSASQSQTPPPWMPRVLSWLSSAHMGASASLARSTADPFVDEPSASPVSLLATAAVLAEVPASMARVKEAFHRASEDPSTDDSLVDSYLLADDADWSNDAVSELARTLDAAPLFTRLLVLTYWAIPPAELRALGPLLLAHHMLGVQEKSVAWLLNYVAEKDASSVHRLLETALTSPDHSVRLDTVVRLSTLYDLRARIALEEHVPDPRGRRPFKQQKRPIGFAPTEIGRPTRDVQEATKENDPRYEGLPYALRKRLAALDWDGEGDAHAFLAQDGRTTPPGRKSPARGLSPQSRSPHLRPGSRSPSPSPDASDLPVFSDALLSAAAVHVSALLKDDDPVIVAASRDLLMTITREDPTAVSRPLVTDLFRYLGDPARSAALLESLHSYLDLQPVIDPTVAFFAFNHIVGLLKHLARTGRFADSLSAVRTFGSLLSVAARSAPHVAEVSIRDLRRNKVEFLLPTGALWFDETAPASEMFPRAPPSAAKVRDEALISALVEVRVAQNALTCSIVRSSKKEVYSIKKPISRFMSPRVLRKSSRSRSFIPQPPGTQTLLSLPPALEAASQRYAVSWATLIHQALAALNRNYSDRVELAHLMEALNDLLLSHSTDGEVVGLCLQSFMVAMTRFQRLFISTSAFTLIAPPLFQVYCQTELPDVRDGIEYAVRRFLNVQEEAFVFQLCASLAHVVLDTSIVDPAQRRWIAQSLFALLASLSTPLAPEAGVGLGLRGRNESYEAELLLNLVLEAPEIDILKLRLKGDEGQSLRSAVASRWEERTMSLDSVVKLFLTVIALEPHSVQANLFLRTLTLLAPEFVGSRTTSSEVLRQGVEALGVVFSKRTGRQATSDDRTDAKSVSWNELSYALLPPGQSAAEVTWEGMRKAYLGLVEAYLESGGEMSASAMRKVLALLPSFLVDAGPPLALTASAVLTCFDRTSTARAERASAADAVALAAIATRSRALLREYSAVLAPEADEPDPTRPSDSASVLV